jgi:hypothetical protein
MKELVSDRSVTEQGVGQDTGQSHVSRIKPETG